MTNYEGPDLGLRALLALVEETPAEERTTNEDCLGLIQDGFPGSMVAFLKTVAHTGIEVSLSRYVLEGPGSLDGLDGADVLESALEDEDYDRDNVIVIGREVGGESKLLWGWRDGDEQPAILQWDSENEELGTFGTFTNLFERIYEEFADDLDDQLPEDFGEDLETLLKATESWEKNHSEITFKRWKAWYASELPFDEWEASLEDEDSEEEE